ncbi:MAG: hypothetical protein J6N73_00540 [Prevotella sp.]|jgi:hypothetical protein|nr:hypothetical protein [Prevotella sp.]
MMRILKCVYLAAMLLLAPITADAVVGEEKSGYDWTPVMDAIIQVESKGNEKAVCGKYVGVLQISPILVKECNNILKSRGSSKRYTLNDRYNGKKSREMFVIIQSQHNPMNNIERAIRLWNGGIRYNVAKTQRYFNKVMSYLR